MVFGFVSTELVFGSWVDVLRREAVGSSMFYHHHAKRRHMQWGASVAHMRFA